MNEDSIRITRLEQRVQVLEDKDRRHNMPIGNSINRSKKLIIKAEKEGIERRSKNK